MRTLTSIIIVSSVLLISACSSTNTGDKSSLDARHGSADPRSVGTVNASSDPLNDPRGPLAKRSIYFDLDSYSVKKEFGSVIENHSKYLQSNQGRKIIIQGNTDERGGAEYNLALGQKRAEAVRKSLTLMGVPESRIEAVSFGKEKPKALGNDEASWAENRRADIVYQTK